MIRLPPLQRRAFIVGGLALGLTGLSPLRCLPTAKQTAGPFYPEDWSGEHEFDLSQLAGHTQAAQGQRIVVTGRVLDTHCQPLAGAVVDLWQANAHGRYAHPADRNPAPLDPHFQGAGRIVTDAEGRYRFVSIKPAAYALAYIDGNPSDAGFRPAHLHFKVSAAGLSDLTTQMYFAGDPYQDDDVILSRLSDAQRDAVIIAPSGDASADYAFDIHLPA